MLFYPPAHPGLRCAPAGRPHLFRRAAYIPKYGWQGWLRRPATRLRCWWGRDIWHTGVPATETGHCGYLKDVVGGGVDCTPPLFLPFPRPLTQHSAWQRRLTPRTTRSRGLCRPGWVVSDRFHPRNCTHGAVTLCSSDCISTCYIRKTCMRAKRYYGKPEAGVDDLVHRSSSNMAQV